jgi:nucleotide-binding universal stress UspA family protein
MDALCESRRAAAEAQLAALCPDGPPPLHLRRGKTYLEVIRHVIEGDTDLVIKAAEPLSGLQRFLFASTDQHLLRKCPCPVWLQTAQAAAAPRRVLAAVDIDIDDAAEPETLRALNRRVLDAARHVAAPDGAQVTLLHVWEAMGDGMVWAFSAQGDAQAASEAYVAEIHAARHAALAALIEDQPGPPALTPLLVRGTPEQVIDAQSRALSADVVVMGTVARTGLRGVFIGNTAENIINSLGCPVLAVKPPGFVSPLDRRAAG